MKQYIQQCLVLCCRLVNCDEGVITSPLGADKDISEAGFAMTLFDGLKRHLPTATALASYRAYIIYAHSFHFARCTIIKRVAIITEN